MLSTNEKAVFGLITPKGKERGHLLHFDRPMPNIWDSENQHLYFLSDDDIKEGDWFLEKGLSINLFPNYVTDKNECKKIIATTDKLRVINKDEFSGVDNQHLPQPSESFLQKFIYAYNNGDPITEVMVEYNHLQSTTGLNEEWLKVNSSDNTITIRKMKDSWTREEVINLCREAINYGKDYNGNLSEKWIEYNL